MIQIVDQSADAFDMAEKKMRAIRMQTNVMFGRNGHVSPSKLHTSLFQD